MPELPEVETIKRDLESKILNTSILGIEIRDDRVLHSMSRSKFIQQLENRTFSSVSRRGKGLIFGMDDGQHIFVQVKMTGHFVLGEKSDVKETKVIFRLSNGQYLNYNDQRLFGWFFLVKDLHKIPYLQTIGIEPLSSKFTVKWLTENLKGTFRQNSKNSGEISPSIKNGRRTPIKPLLMNQHFVAGIGNIYASEILFKARIHPKKRANKLTQKQINLLHQYTVDILNESIEHRGTSMRNYRDAKGEKGSFMNRIQVYGKADEPCPECKSLIKRIVQAQRSTFYCTQCQK